MDAVELPYPVDVAVPSKLMGSEGFGGARVTIKEVGEDCDPKRVSILVNASIQSCNTLIKQKDATSSVSSSGLASWQKIPEAELCRLPDQLNSLHDEDSSEHLNSRGTNHLSTGSRPEGVQLQRKAGKHPRSSNGASKRQRVAHSVDIVNPAGVDDIKDISNKQGSYPTKFGSPDKAQMVKQKNSFGHRRGDRKNSKDPLKIMASFTSAAGGNNFFGLYGLKSDINDITKLVDDLSLHELLDGSYQCPTLVKEKGKKAESTNDNFLSSVRKACAILPLTRPAISQNFAEIGSCSDKKLAPCPPSSVSMVTSGGNSDKGDSCPTDLSLHNKDCCDMHETRAILLDFPLCQPKHILERLALPPPKDLESLLQDAARASQHSRSTSDQRSAKQICRRVSLPPFPWSHSFGGHGRTNSDAAKLLTSRSTCQGRWGRIGNTASFFGNATNCSLDLDSLTYDESLVPFRGPKPANVENKILSRCGNHCRCELGSSFVAASIHASHVILEHQIEREDQENAAHCPEALGAAQILCDIATQFLRPSADGILRWPKKLSQKTMKARKLKLIEKSEEVYETSTLVLGSDRQKRSMDQVKPSKRPKLSLTEDKRDPTHTDIVRKGPINWSSPRSSRGSISWSSPRSSRLSPSVLVRESIAERKHSSANTVKQSCMMPPPPPRVSDKACSSQPKLRQMIPMDWDRGRGRQE